MPQEAMARAWVSWWLSKVINKAIAVTLILIVSKVFSFFNDIKFRLCSKELDHCLAINNVSDRMLPKEIVDNQAFLFVRLRTHRIVRRPMGLTLLLIHLQKDMALHLKVWPLLKRQYVEVTTLWYLPTQPFQTLPQGSKVSKIIKKCQKVIKKYQKTDKIAKKYGVILNNILIALAWNSCKNRSPSMLISLWNGVPMRENQK